MHQAAIERDAVRRSANDSGSGNSLPSGTGVVEVIAGVGLTVAIPTTEVPFGRSANDGLITSSPNFTFDSSLGRLQVLGLIQGPGGGVADQAAIVAQAGKNNAAGALDVYTEATGTQGEFLSRWYQQGQVPSQTSVPASYMQASGAFYTRSYIVASGTVSGMGVNSRFTHPTADPFMVGVWADVADAIVSRANSAGNRVHRGISAAGNDIMYLADTGVFSVAQDAAGTLTSRKRIVLTPASVKAEITSTAATDIALYKLTTVDPYTIELGQASSSPGVIFAGQSLANRGYLLCTGTAFFNVLTTDGFWEWQTNGVRRWQMYQGGFYALDAGNFINVAAITGKVFYVPTDATGNVTAATGRIPIDVAGGTKYIRYYDD